MTGRRAAGSGLSVLLLFSLILSVSCSKSGPTVLKLLRIETSPESVDYVKNKTQFQLHTLLTEQRHQKTWNLSQTVREDTLAGLRMLSAVDDDIRVKLEAMAADTRSLDDAAAAVEAAILAKRKIYIYGCGATGRLAKQMESAFWRPFWRRLWTDPKLWPKIPGALTSALDNQLIGEMTGADRALISSLEGFEDLQLIGRLQLQDRGITKGDVVICVTEGGETSSVIGTILAAHAQWTAEPGYDPEFSRKNLYFVYNNPDERLMPFERSRKVLEEPGITKINLTTGPQAITGSTRMQATTIETYVVGTILEAAVARVLNRFLPAGEMAELGFGGGVEIGPRLREFGSILEAVRVALPGVARLTEIEAKTYEAGSFSTYFAVKGLITVFIDSTERSPTFRLYPLDTIKEPQRKCWIQVWTAAETLRDAWRAFLGRPFRGLDPDFYRIPFETEIDDPYLRQAALESLKKAGGDQQDLYDFSMSPSNVEGRGPKARDLAVIVCLTPEEAELARFGSPFRKFMGFLAREGTSEAALVLVDEPAKEPAKTAEEGRAVSPPSRPDLIWIPVCVPTAGDPFGLKQQVAAKMILNAHSTAVMAKLGKVIGNTMTNVSPSNLKLIGRATYLIQSHVNDVLGRPAWIKAYGRGAPITYAVANAVLFDSIAYLKGKQNEAGQTAEVALSIIRILESLRERRGTSGDEALKIVRDVGLAYYLETIK
jgi:N-acetylmuramic acid 6-phosphate (MurNAc-6-P) etherase